MKVQITGYQPVAHWKWALPSRPGSTDDEQDDDEICGICRLAFDYACPQCQYLLDCPVVFGKCNHNFHAHCIESWISAAGSNGLCPMDRQKWEPHSMHENVHDTTSVHTAHGNNREIENNENDNISVTMSP